MGGVLIACIYLPSGNPQPGPKFDYKLAWFDRLIAHAAELQAAGVPAVLAGDFNVVPMDMDIYPTESWADDALLQPESRAAFQRLLDQGWTDAIRTLHRADPTYRSGTTSGIDGGATPAFASITSCSVHPWQAAWWRPELIARSVDRPEPVIMRQPGSCSADDDVCRSCGRKVRRLRDRG